MPRRPKVTLSRFFLEPVKSTKTEERDDQLNKKALQIFSTNKISNPFMGFTNEEIENAKLFVRKMKICIRCSKNDKHSHTHKYSENRNINNSKRSNVLNFAASEKSECIVKLSRITNIRCNIDNQVHSVNSRNENVVSKYWNPERKNQFKGFTEEEKKCSYVICNNFKTNLNVLNSAPVKINRCSKNISKNSTKNYIISNDIASKSTRPRICKQLNSSNNSIKKSNKNNICSKYWNCQNTEMYIKLEKCDFKLSDVSNMFKLEFKKLEKSTSLKSEGNLKSIKKEPGVNYLISPRKIRKIKDEKKDVKIKIITGFIPPKSPHNLIEEQLWNDPWALLIATIFLNRTSCQIARPYVFWFLNDNPNPSLVLEKNVNDLEIYFRALGLQTTRAKQVWRMSYDYIYKNWKRVGELYGVGRYGEDAFRMFCLGDFSVEPKDRYLKIYKAWYEMNEKNERIKEMNC